MMDYEELAEWWRTATPEQRDRVLLDNPWLKAQYGAQNYLTYVPANTATTGKRAPEPGVARPPEAEIGDVRPDNTAPRPKRDNPEARLVSDIIEAAHIRGWLCYHQRPARTGRGYRTALQGDAGFPDLVLVHPRIGGVIFAEVKSDKGRLSPAQQLWRRELCESDMEFHVWRPADWPEIVKILEAK